MNVGDVVESKRSGIVYTITKIKKVNDCTYYETDKDYGFFEFEEEDYPLFRPKLTDL